MTTSERVMAHILRNSQDLTVGAYWASDAAWQAYAHMSEEVREEVPSEDFAGPHNTFPIRNQADVEHAAMLLHHAGDPTAVRKRISEIAKKKGLALPHSWGAHLEK